MSYDATRRPPVVTDADRQWAMDQKPADWDERARGLEWEQHVAEQAERFEAHFGADRKPTTEWAGLWRRVWWPKADPAILHPRAAPHVPHPFVKRDDAGWERALAVLDADERKVALRYGVIQFKPADPRATCLTAKA